MSTPAWSRMEAERAFARAARARRRASLVCRFRGGNGRCGDLPVYDEGTPRRPAADRRRGVREIPLDAISGTVEPNRAAQFDSGFRPAGRTRARWQRVWLAEHAGTVLPPISVVQVGGAYALRDGHHRVSVAKARGALTIDAIVAALDIPTRGMLRSRWRIPPTRILNMRIEPIKVEHASDKARELLDELAARGTAPGPMVRAMANAPALLRAYVDLTRAMKRSHIDRRISERISLAVQEWLGCDYCVAAHSDAAGQLGLSETDVELARQGTAIDPKVAAMVAFSLEVLVSPAEITDERVAELHDHGYSDEQIAEVPGLVALNVLTGSFNLVAGLHVDRRSAP